MPYHYKEPITKEFLDKLQAWAEAGDRTVTIKLGRETEIHVFDNTWLDGMYITADDMLPTEEQLKARKLDKLREELESLEANV